MATFSPGFTSMFQPKLVRISINTPASKYFKVVIVRLDWTIQESLKKLDSILQLDRGIKSGNDMLSSFIYINCRCNNPNLRSCSRTAHDFASREVVQVIRCNQKLFLRKTLPGLCDVVESLQDGVLRVRALLQL
jgi:hypothetical protein